MARSLARILFAAATLAVILGNPSFVHARQQQADVWKPAATPKGGVSWRVLEATGENARKGPDGYIVSTPIFTKQVRALEGRRITVAGWMDAFEPGRTQTHFLLMAYPPGCPFHFHAAPNQYIEVKASKPFPLSDSKVIAVTGTLRLTGQDESGIFYVLENARPA